MDRGEVDDLVHFCLQLHWEKEGTEQALSTFISAPGVVHWEICFDDAMTMKVA